MKKKAKKKKKVNIDLKKVTSSGKRLCGPACKPH